jgi:hypothetical protein
MDGGTLLRTLRPHQERGRDWLLGGIGRALFWRMGGGKTAAALAAMQTHRERYGGTAWIIAPRLVADITWPDEIAAWPQFGLEAVRIRGGPEQRRRQLTQDLDGIYLLHYEQMVWAAGEVKAGRVAAPSLLVLDEASAIRNPASLRWRRAVYLGAWAKARWLLTGSPMGNAGLVSAWALVTCMDLGATWGSSFSVWRDRHFDADERGWRWFPKPETIGIVHAALAPLAQSLSDADYVNVPTNTIPVWVELPERGRHVYDSIAAGLCDELRQADVMDLRRLETLLSPLRQVVGGAVYREPGNPSAGWSRIHEAKLDRLEELLGEVGNSIVYCQFRHEVERLRSRWPRAPVLAGGVYESDAARIVREWVAGEHELLIAHPAAAAYGLNMAAGGCSVVWFTLPFSIELYEQGNARLARPGQRDRVTISQLLARDTVDVVVARILRDRGRVERDLLQALSIAG